MFEKLANIFRIPDLRKRVLFTLGICWPFTAWAGIFRRRVSTRSSSPSSSSSTEGRFWVLWTCSPAASSAA